MGAVYKDENMKEHNILMGCYGIGVGRTMAAIVEQCHDENGIMWPIAVAPYHVIITVVKAKDAEQMALAEKIEAELSAQGVEVIVDDRDERPGVKFKDADLIGIPGADYGRRKGCGRYCGIQTEKRRRYRRKVCGAGGSGCGRTGKSGADSAFSIVSCERKEKTDEKVYD